RSVDSKLERPSSGIDASLQNRRPDHLQLRLLRRADRSRAARQRSLSRRQKTRVGLQKSPRKKLSRSRPIHPAPLPRRLEDLKLLWARFTTATLQENIPLSARRKTASIPSGLAAYGSWCKDRKD